MLSNFADVDVVSVILPVHVEDAGDVTELVHVLSVLLCVASKVSLSIAVITVILSNFSFSFPETFRCDDAEMEDVEVCVEGPGDGDVPGAGVEASPPASSRRGGQAEPFWSTMFCWPSPPTS